jgi:hypothetical protein
MNVLLKVGTIRSFQAVVLTGVGTMAIPHRAVVRRAMGTIMLSDGPVVRRGFGTLRGFQMRRWLEAQWDNAFTYGRDIVRNKALIAQSTCHNSVFNPCQQLEPPSIGYQLSRDVTMLLVLSSLHLYLIRPAIATC